VVDGQQSVLRRADADLLSMLPFLGLIVLLYLVSREVLFSPKRTAR
jgi:hypothetical protein